MPVRYFGVTGVFLCSIAVLFFSSTLTLGQPTSGRIKFSFDGYGNPQRPFPGYVGPFQLGPVRLRGSGEIDRRTGAIVSGGTIGHSDDLRDRRYPSHRTNWQVLSLLGFQSSGGVTTLRLGVRVTATNYASICPIGTYGIIELVDDNRLLANRLTADSIRTEMPNPSAINAEGTLACGTHTHGMNNVDYSWTDPPRGGYGIWANVTITASRESILGRWMRTSDRSIVEFFRRGNQIIGVIRSLGSLRYGFYVGEETFVLADSTNGNFGGQVKYRSTDGRQWWQATSQIVVGNRMTGAGDWSRVR